MKGSMYRRVTVARMEERVKDRGGLNRVGGGSVVVRTRMDWGFVRLSW